MKDCKGDKMKNKRNTIIAIVLFIGFLSAGIYGMRQTAKTKDANNNRDSTYNSDGNISPAPRTTAAPSESTGAPGNSGGSVPQSTASPGGQLNTIRNITPATPKTTGNTSSNILNRGHLDYQEPWIYFSQPFRSSSTGLYRSMPDSQTGLKKLSDAQAGCINVVGSWVYFINIINGGIYKVTINGTEESRINREDVSASNLIVRGGWLYFIDASTEPEPVIYKMKEDGSELTMLAKGIRFSVSDDNDWLYYVSLKEGHLTNLSRVKTDGNDGEVLSSAVINSFFQQGNWLYTSEIVSTQDVRGYKNVFYRMNRDGTGKQRIIDDWGIGAINVTDSYIFYTQYKPGPNNSPSHLEVYRMRTDGTWKLKLNRDNISDYSSGMYTVGDWIYLESSGYSNQASFYRIKADGSKEIGVN
jgi:hypothetical protein